MTNSPTEGAIPLTTSARAFELLDELHQPPTLSTFRVRDSHVECPAGRVLWAIEPSGSRHLLVPTVAVFRADTRSAGVQIIPLHLTGADGEVPYADVRCALPHLRTVFAVLADEMLSAVAANPASALGALTGVLDRWRELLEPERTRLLGPHQLAALFGELLALEDAWARSGHASPSVWRGPLHQPHDISDDRVAMEVKETTVREGLPVEVHGIQQLEPPAGGVLLLRVYRFEVSTVAGANVPSAVHRLLDATDDRAALIALLAAVGYRLADEEAYRSVSFLIRDERTYLVKDDFPAITARQLKSGLPPSVREVRYVVELGGASPAWLTEDEIHRYVSMIGRA